MTFSYTGIAADPNNVSPEAMAERIRQSDEATKQTVAQQEANVDRAAMDAKARALNPYFKNAQQMQDYNRRGLAQSTSTPSYTEDKSYITGGIIPASAPIYPQPPPTPSPVLQNPTYYPDMRSNREFQAKPTVVPNPGDPYGITFRSAHAQYQVPSSTYDQLAVGHGVTDSAQSSKIAQGQISAMMNTLPQSFTSSETFQTFRQNLQYFTDRNLLTPEQVNDILSSVQNNAPMGILQGGDWVNQLNDYVNTNGSLPSNFKTDGQSLASLMCQKFSAGTLSGMLYAITADADISQDRRNNILQSLTSEYSKIGSDALARSGYKKVVIGGVPLYLDLKTPLTSDVLQSNLELRDYLKSKNVSSTDRQNYTEEELGGKLGIGNNLNYDGFLMGTRFRILKNPPPDVLNTGGGMFQSALDNLNATLKNQPLTQWQTGTSSFLTGGVQQHGNIVDVVEHAILSHQPTSSFTDRDSDHPMSYGLEHPGVHALQTGYDLFESASNVLEGNAVSGYLEKAATAAASEGGIVAETFGVGVAETAGEALGVLSGAAEIAGVAAAVVGIAEGVNELLEVFGVVHENIVSEEVTKLWNDVKGLL